MSDLDDDLFGRTEKFKVALSRVNDNGLYLRNILKTDFAPEEYIAIATEAIEENSHSLEYVEKSLMNVAQYEKLCYDACMKDASATRFIDISKTTPNFFLELCRRAIHISKNNLSSKQLSFFKPKWRVVSSEDSCGICISNIPDADEYYMCTFSHQNHLYCKECFDRWVQTSGKGSCVLCFNDMHPNVFFNAE
jgi:hypothetical protein